MEIWKRGRTKAWTEVRLFLLRSWRNQKLKLKQDKAMLWQLLRKPPNIEMIHLFSSNFLFGWMMEHCREDKLSLVESEPRLVLTADNRNKKPKIPQNLRKPLCSWTKYQKGESVSWFVDLKYPNIDIFNWLEFNLSLCRHVWTGLFL